MYEDLVVGTGVAQQLEVRSRRHTVKERHTHTAYVQMHRERLLTLCMSTHISGTRSIS